MHTDCKKTLLGLSLWLCLLVSTATHAAASVPWDADAQGQFITSLCRDTHGNVWIGTEDQGVWRCNPSAPKDRQYTHFTTKDGLGDDNAYALACDKSGRVWAGTLNHGVSVYNGKEWKTYGVLDGPLGSRVFALAVSPKDGGVWGATEAGLFRYQNSHWSYFTRADGLPSDQAQCLAFAPDGLLYVGTQCDGIAVGSPDDGYKTWRIVSGPQQLPNLPTGAGLPSPLINCLLAASDGTVYAGTSDGLARSRDGDRWNFVRGVDWKAKAAGMNPPAAPSAATFTGDLLREDYVTCLAEDISGRLWVGHRQGGVEVFDPKTQRRLQSGANGEHPNDYVAALLTDGKEAYVGLYGGGLFPPAADKAPGNVPRVTAVTSFPPLPIAAAPPSQAEMTKLLALVRSLKADLPVGGATYLGDDWQTQGDAVGRYGRQYARLFAMQSPWGDHFPVSSPGYMAVATIGPRYRTTDALRAWVQTVQTDNPRSLYDPQIGYRRQAEADDHGETYDQTSDGPDIWMSVSVPQGVHRVSLYFFNKDGHDGNNRDRDYLVSLLPYRVKMAEAQTLAPLAQARVHDFWGGVYKSFLVRGPNPYYVKIARNYSQNTICSAIFIDKLLPQPAKTDDMPTLWLGNVHYGPPSIGEKQIAITPPAKYLALWSAMDAAYGKQGAEGLQLLVRLLSYRSALTSGASPDLLANWRWRMVQWQDSDRVGFRETMASARRSFRELNGDN